MPKNDKIEQYCAQCKRVNEFNVIQTVTDKNKPNEGWLQWIEHFQIVGCGGCGKKAFRNEYGDEDMCYNDPDMGDQHYTTVEVYPRELHGHIEIKNMHRLPESVKKAYNESLIAFKNKCVLLTAAGFRLVIEAVCQQQEIEGDHLPDKIDNLNKILSQDEIDDLHGVNSLGVQSVHYVKPPTEEQLFAALSLIENLLITTYKLNKEKVSHILLTKYSTYHDFLSRLELALSKVEEGEERSLFDYFGKEEAKRFSLENFKLFEEQLIEEINNEKYKTLLLGGVTQTKKTTNQKYILAVDPDTLDPFTIGRKLKKYFQATKKE